MEGAGMTSRSRAFNLRVAVGVVESLTRLL